jgi:hypothetical protein
MILDMAESWIHELAASDRDSSGNVVCSKRGEGLRDILLMGVILLLGLAAAAWLVETLVGK